MVKDVTFMKHSQRKILKNLNAINLGKNVSRQPLISVLQTYWVDRLNFVFEQIWNLGSPEPNFTLEAHQKGVNCVEYFTGGDRPHLITGSDDQTAKVCGNPPDTVWLVWSIAQVPACLTMSKSEH